MSSAFSRYRVARTAALALAALVALPFASAGARERVLLDSHWKFFLGDDAAASQPDFNDASWRTVDLPHDWSIEGQTEPKAPSGGAGGYLPSGVGWYRRTFDVPANWRDQRVAIEFEGVYQHAEVWINGQRLGMHAYGYTPFSYDLTPHLKPGTQNVIAVRVDNSAQSNCRWYSGSGIYRHVWLEAVDPVHLLRDELFASTQQATKSSASIQVIALLANDSDVNQNATIEFDLLDPVGQSVATRQSLDTIPVAGHASGTALLNISNPQLWSPESPALYQLVARVKNGDRTIDELITPIGIRTVKVSPEVGFELNGQPLKLVGGCVHHDNGLLGAAALDRAEIRRVELMKAAGFNAIRTSHNPPSTAFLSACDRIGVLVVDEAFDGWAKKKTPYDYSVDFAANWPSDLEAMVRRDRNHPSVVMWSIGNELYERGDPSGAEIARNMTAFVRRLDSTRPITAACNAVASDDKWPTVDGLYSSLDVAGYNYQLRRIDRDHERLPNRVILVTESFQNEAFNVWAACNDHEFVIGDFVWSGLDYLGESSIGRVFDPDEKLRQHWEGDHYPWHGAYCGDLDATGWRKPISHYRNILWNRGEKLYAAVVAPTPSGEPWKPGMWAMPPALPSWNWPGAEGRNLTVEVYSRHDAVRLYFNGKPIGEKPTTREQQFKAAFEVPYAPGQLRIVGVDNGAETETFSLSNAAGASRIRLTSERKIINSDGQDLAFVTVEIADVEGVLRADATASIHYTLTGPGKIVGIGSGDMAATEPYNANPRHAFQGRAIVVVRATNDPGEITLTAEAEGLGSLPIKITSARY